MYFGTNRPTSNLLDEFLFLQPGERRTLLTKETNELVRHTIPHGLDSLLKQGEFLSNLVRVARCVLFRQPWSVDTPTPSHTPVLY